MDRRIILILIAFIIIFEYQYIYIPNKRKVKNLENLILKKEKEYNEFIELCEKYKKGEIKEKNYSVEVATDRFSLFSYLNDLIEVSSIKTNISDINILPKEKINEYLLEKIEIQINLITIEQLLSILEKLEKTKGIYIYQFEMKRDKNKPYLLNTSMIISCLQLNKSKTNI
ncbi:MAG: hypothetical protein NC827_00970 [Candidatus Omnitrophica bacterium]|nr:hypothetical protein [Candidatus Omnitrophota bacterium]MCM8801874.1 hypothetical protein [Candidatus Omnitrophota bacterium]